MVELDTLLLFMQDDESKSWDLNLFAMAYNACYVASQELLQEHFQQGFLNVTENLISLGILSGLHLIQVSAILCVRMAFIAVLRCHLP